MDDFLRALWRVCLFTRYSHFGLRNASSFLVQMKQAVLFKNTAKTNNMFFEVAFRNIQMFKMKRNLWYLYHSDAVAQSVASALPKTGQVGTWIESRKGKI